MTDQPYTGHVPFLVSSDGGNCYIRLVPDGPMGMAERACAYRVGKDCGSDQALWQTDWMASSVVISNNGHVLMRLIAEASVEDASTDPAIVSFYRDGREFRFYRFSEIVTPTDGTTLLDGRRLWCDGDLHEWRDNGIEVVDLPLAGGRIVAFDLNSGERRTSTASDQHSPTRVRFPASGEPDSRIGHGWLVGAVFVVGLVLGLLARRVTRPAAT